MADYVPLFAVGLAGILAIPTFLIQKWYERRDEHRKQKAQSYRRYVTAFWAANRSVGTEKHEEAQEEYQSALGNLFIIAADETLLRTSDFHIYMLNHPRREDKDLDEITKLYTAMITAMRRDSFQPTKLTDEEIRSRLTFSI